MSDSTEMEKLKDLLYDNPYMKYYKPMVGRKVNTESVIEILTTAHTDTSNIYSHFIGGLMLLLTAVFYCTSIPSFTVTICSMATCFMSTCYHIFRNFSAEYYNFSLFFDVIGIKLQIVAFSICCSLALLLPYSTKAATIYVAAALLMFAVSIAVLPGILRRKLYWLRSLMLVIEASENAIVVIHGWFYYGNTDEYTRFVVLTIITFSCHGLGMIIRSAHVPERFFPDTVWQKFFHSHFWFHICVLIGSFTETYTMEYITHQLNYL